MNDNRRKIKGKVADWWLSMYSLPNKPMLPELMERYNAVRLDRGFPLLTESAVNKWLNEPDVQRKWVLGQHGKEEWRRRFGHYVSRRKRIGSLTAIGR